MNSSIVLSQRPIDYFQIPTLATPKRSRLVEKRPQLGCIVEEESSEEAMPSTSTIRPSEETADKLQRKRPRGKWFASLKEFGDRSFY